MVRHAQLARFRRKPSRTLVSDAAQVAGLALGVAAAVSDAQLRVAPLVALGLVAVFHVSAARRTPPAAAVLGIQQVLLGLMVVVVTAIGVHAS